MTVANFSYLVKLLNPYLPDAIGKSVEETTRLLLQHATNGKIKKYSPASLNNFAVHGLSRSAAKEVLGFIDKENSPLIDYFDEIGDDQLTLIARSLKNDGVSKNVYRGIVPAFINKCFVTDLKKTSNRKNRKKQKKPTTCSGHGHNDISLTIRDEGNVFEKTFNPIREVKLPLRSSKVRSFALLPVKGVYSHKNLISLLRKNLARYVFSRKNRNECDDLEELTAEATTELREFTRKCDPQTLLGELLVYIFLEHCEKAPKILTRAEFYQKYGTVDKKSVFLGKDDAGWQLIIGTPNLSATLDQAILTTLKDCEKLRNKSDFGGGPYVAEQLQDSFLEDSYYPEQINKIEAIVFPSLERKSLGVQVDSYGIFLGYQVDDFGNDEERVNKELTVDAERATEMISNFVTSHGMDRHPIYVYLLPFKNPEYESSQIIDKLVGR